jgi:beta-glucosidase
MQLDESPPSHPLDGLVARLDLASKVRLLTGASMFTVHGEDTIGLAAMAFSDGPTGVRGRVFSGGPSASLLPNATLLASSWSTESAGEVGRLLAEEAQRQQIHVVLGPTINLHRSPLGGRLFEAYSEDPLLTGVLASAYVIGLQSEGTGACLKHLVANEAETERHTVNSVVDERTLREVYLAPFEIAVQDSDPWSIMAAYNDVNGVPATEHDEINNGILKGEWGWSGLVMSDWFATKSAAPAANGGLDLVMPGPEGPWGDALVVAVQDGQVAESVIDEHVGRLLVLASRVGALGEERRWPAGLPEPASDLRREQLTRLAAGGMTVLTNDGVLPLSADTRVTVIGRHAIETVGMGGGSAQVKPPHQVSVAKGLADKLGDKVRVVDGVEVRGRVRSAEIRFVTNPRSGRPGMHTRVLGATGKVLRDVDVPAGEIMVGLDNDLPEPAARAKLTARVPAGAIRLGAVGAGVWTLEVAGEEHSATVTLETEDVGEAVLRPPGWSTDVVLDKPAEVTASLELTEVSAGRIGLVAEPVPRGDEVAIEEAVRVAEQSDVAVIVVGLTEEQETEAIDKTTLELPGGQDDLVSAVAAVTPRTVVVVNAATPILMPWLDQVDAVLWAGIPGQEAGHAVAAALLNEIEPSGRLVTSFPSADGASTAWEVTPTHGLLEYSEGRYVGYRGHAAGRAPAPAFWFGHGLGYGSWEYAGATAEAGPSGTVTVSVDITNTSMLDSREVVQVYLDPQVPDQPVRLVGWTPVKVASGARASVTVDCDERMWRTWDVRSHSWWRLAGGELVVARGLGDVRCRLPAPAREHEES